MKTKTKDSSRRQQPSGCSLEKGFLGPDDLVDEYSETFFDMRDGECLRRLESSLPNATSQGFPLSNFHGKTQASTGDK
jgi:hypothetical protein